MLQPPRLTVWASVDELQSLKSLFYEQVDGRDGRPHALEIIRAWSSRGRLPHAIESTAQLTECILHDTLQQSELMLRMGYSTAICRFVNGLLDPAQKSHFAVSMYNLAQEQGLPASFVDVRHAATHEALPPLCVLRTTCSRALDWLWEHYWSMIESSHGGTDIIDQGIMSKAEEMRIAQVQNILRTWEDLKKGNQGKQRGSAKRKDERSESNILAELSRILNDSLTDNGLILEVLVHEHLLVMEHSGKMMSIYKETDSWKALIQHLDRHVEGFTPQLLNTMVDALQEDSEEATTSIMDEFAESESEFTYQWLEFLITLLLQGKLAAGNVTLLDDIVSQCILTQKIWCLRLAEHAIGQSAMLETKYSQAYTMAKKQLINTPRAAPNSDIVELETKNVSGFDDNGTRMDIDNELEDFEARLKQMQARREQWALGNKKDNTKGGSDKRTNGTQNGISSDAPLSRTTAPKFRQHEGSWTAKPIGIA